MAKSTSAATRTVEADLLGDPDLAQVVGLDRVSLALEDGVEFGLEDIDVDPARVRELAGAVFPELADVEDDAGEVGMGVVAEVDDLDPRVLAGEEGAAARSRNRPAIRINLFILHIIPEARKTSRPGFEASVLRRIS